MARALTEQQQSLAGRVWELSDHRAAVLRQLAEVEQAQHQAIALAELHGVRQVRLAELAGVTRARVSQIVAATDVPNEPIAELELRWQKMIDLHAARAITTAEARDEWNRRFELVHGKPGNLGASVPDNYS